MTTPEQADMPQASEVYQEEQGFDWMLILVLLAIIIIGQTLAILIASKLS